MIWEGDISSVIWEGNIGRVILKGDIVRPILNIRGLHFKRAVYYFCIVFSNCSACPPVSYNFLLNIILDTVI